MGRGPAGVCQRAAGNLPAMRSMSARCPNGYPASIDANEVIGLDAVEQFVCVSCADPQSCPASNELAEPSYGRTSRGTSYRNETTRHYVTVPEGASPGDHPGGVTGVAPIGDRLRART